LEAPFDGWIGQVKAHKHQNVASGESVVTLNAGRDIKMYIAVPDTYIRQVNEGSKVKVWFDAVPGQEMEGEVAEISVDSSSGSTYPVKVYLANKDRLIRSGMSGHVTFEGKVVGKGGALVPPVAVVGNTDGTRSVWVVDPATSSVTRRDVSVGQLTAHGLEVLEGVKPGDQVVIRGMGRMKEGLKVRLMTQNTEG
jgi:RND family efflux transporter MFP subunit